MSSDSFLEITESLAKLFCQENIDVRFDAKAVTASFAPDQRVMTFPILKDGMHRTVYNLFCAHESSHALHTPAGCFDTIRDMKLPPMLVNIVEDVRIEKLIQQKFPGLRRDFREGYRRLNDMDFFAIKNIDVSALNFIDRVNLHFKLGSLAMIPFSEEEQSLLELIDSCETFEDVIRVSSELVTLVPQPSDSKPERIEPDDEEQSSGMSSGQSEQTTNNTEEQEENNTEEQDSEEQSTSEHSTSSPPDHYWWSRIRELSNDKQDEKETEQQSNQQEQQSENNSGTDSEEDDRFNSKTQTSFDSSMRQSIEKSNQICMIDTNRDSIFDNIFPIEELQKYYHSTKSANEHYYEYFQSKAKESYHKFRKNSKSEVNFLTQQFQMKKSADEYRRSGSAKTGTIDVNMLHKYTLTDDIFLRNVVVPTGKNHGMVMLLDFSGSMRDIITGVIKQCLILVAFCRKVGIPYEVFAFGVDNTAFHRLRELQGNDEWGLPEYENAAYYGQQCLVQILSSTRSVRQSEQDEWNLFYWSSYFNNEILSMSGTPLNAFLLGMIEYLPVYKSRNNLQKLSLIVITDGDSHPLLTNRSLGNYGRNYVLRNWRNKKTYKIDYYTAHGETNTCARILRESVPDVELVKIFIGGHRDMRAETQIPSHNGWVKQPNWSVVSSSMKKNSSFFHVPDNNTYHGVMFILSSVFSGDSEIHMNLSDDDPSKGQLRSSFKNMLKKRSTGYNVLSRFIETVS